MVVRLRGGFGRRSSLPVVVITPNQGHVGDPMQSNTSQHRQGGRVSDGGSWRGILIMMGHMVLP